MTKIHELLGVKPHAPFWIKVGPNNIQEYSLSNDGHIIPEDTPWFPEVSVEEYRVLIDAVNGKYKILTEKPITISKEEFSILKYFGGTYIEPISKLEGGNPIAINIVSQPYALNTKGVKIFEWKPEIIAIIDINRFPSLATLKEKVYIDDLKVIS